MIIIVYSLTIIQNYINFLIGIFKSHSNFSINLFGVFGGGSPPMKTVLK